MNKNYRIMKFFKPIDKLSKAKGYLRLEIRGSRGTYYITAEKLSEKNIICEVFLYKNNYERVRIGSINSIKGRLKKNISISELSNQKLSIEDYNICSIFCENKPILYTTIFNDIEVNYTSLIKEVVEEKSDRKDYAKKSADKNSRNIEANKKINTNKQEIKKINNKLEKDNEKEDTFNQKPKVEQKSNNDEEQKGIYKILENFEELNPLKESIDGMKWWKINYDDKSVYKGFLPFFNQIISVYYPYPLTNRVTTCQSLMKKHGFYVFGIYKEENKITKYVYGVPGRFIREEQPYRGITGFKNWSYKNNDVISGNFGFWLAFINAENGKITDPPKVKGSK